MSKVKCYSVRLQSLVSISEKAYKATAFDGSTAILPKSQVFGQDHDVQKSEAYWVSDWILEQKELQYSTKKSSFFDNLQSNASKEEGVEIERHVPEEKEPVEIEALPELLKQEVSLTTLEGKKVTTMQELKAYGNSDEQDSGTSEGFFMLGGKQVFVRKHWSNVSAGVWTAENLLSSIGKMIERNSILVFESKK